LKSLAWPTVIPGTSVIAPTFFIGQESYQKEKKGSTPCHGSRLHAVSPWTVNSISVMIGGHREVTVGLTQRRDIFGSGHRPFNELT